MNSIIFKTTAHIVTGLMLVFSAYLVFRGHNESGGGFIGALVATIAFGVLLLAESVSYVKRRLKFTPTQIAGIGLILAIGSGLLPMLHNLPFLTGLWLEAFIVIGTPLIFDIGVYLTILGSILSILLRIYEVLG